MNITVISDSLYNNTASNTNTIAKALADKGHRVSVILPFYEKIYSDGELKFSISRSFCIKQPQGNFNITLFTVDSGNIKYYFIANNRLFSRDRAWGYHDDAIRTAVLCSAAIEAVLQEMPDTEYIITDGPNTALVSVFLKFKYRHNQICRSIKTFHYINSNNYGIYDNSTVTTVFGMSPEEKHILITNNLVNLTKAAIISASRVLVGENSVDILYDHTNELHHTAIQFGFKIRKFRLGLDYNFFSPENDNDIHTAFSLEDMSGKIENKKFVQRYLYLQENENIPLVIIYPDENTELWRKHMRELTKCDIQIILVSNRLRGCDTTSLPGKIVCIQDRSAETLKNIFSAGDFCIFGTLGSECGNPSFISAVYGCVPVLESHRFFDFGFSYFNKLTLDGNGYTYDPHISKDMMYTLWDALGVYRHDKKTYAKLISNTMKKIFPVSESIATIEKETEKICYSFI